MNFCAPSPPFFQILECLGLHNLEGRLQVTPELEASSPGCTAAEVYYILALKEFLVMIMKDCGRLSDERSHRRK